MSPWHHPLDFLFLDIVCHLFMRQQHCVPDRDCRGAARAELCLFPPHSILCLFFLSVPLACVVFHVNLHVHLSSSGVWGERDLFYENFLRSVDFNLLDLLEL